MDENIPDSMLSGRCILVVEDEMLVAMSIEDALTSEGCAVVGPVATVENAIDTISTERLDAAILDMNLAGTSALPVADALARRSIPFLVLSGYGTTWLPKTHDTVPALTKPFDPPRLVSTLRQLLG